MTDNVQIRFEGVSKRFGNHTVVKNLDLEVRRGEFLTLLGPSGCGKTTILRMIGGFEQPDEGRILIDGEDVSGISAQKRPVNTVFQSYALFPHLSVRGNIEFGLKMKKMPRELIDERVGEVLSMTQLESLADRMTGKLSGGQKQRVAIARSLAAEPEVLLLDEPLGALDLQLRKSLQIEIMRLQKQLGMTYVYVTHDQEEALAMSDRVAVMNDGVLEQLDTPHDVYTRPMTEFVADFVGESNAFHGVIRDGALESDGFRLPVESKNFQDNSLAMLMVRPECIALSEHDPGEGALRGTITNSLFMGELFRIDFSLRDEKGIAERNLFAYETSGDFRPGQDVFVRWKPEHSHLILKKEAVAC